MSKLNFLTLFSALFIFGSLAETCEAGPLLDWLRGRRANNYYRYNAYYPPAQAYPQAQSPGTCMTTCPKTCYQTVNRVVANYVPYTAYRTQWYRVPVTYYRPVTNTNPQSGCVTTCMQPCTTYQMQARRVPYTTYRTVYRTVQHRVPYTTYVTSYGSACESCNTGCSTCGTGGAATGYPGQVSQPAYSGNGMLNTQGGYSSPANSVPQLNPNDIQPDTTLQRPDYVEPPAPIPETGSTTIESDTRNSSHGNPQLNQPQNPVSNYDDNHTASLIRGKWNYSPVIKASFQRRSGESYSSHRVSTQSTQTQRRTNSNAFREVGWKSAN